MNINKNINTNKNKIFALFLSYGYLGIRKDCWLLQEIQGNQCSGDIAYTFALAF